MPPTIEQIRQTLFEVMDTHRTNLQSGSVLREAADQLDMQLDDDSQQVLLTVFGDLFRTGHIAWGHNLSNANPPFFHLTEQGRLAMSRLSRDPVNPEGYLEYLDEIAWLNDVSKSYIQESLKTYNADCYRAAAVMVGAALESIILDLRDALVSHLGDAAPKKLKGDLLKPIIDTMTIKLNELKSEMSNDLKGRYETSWSTLAYQIRSTRNEAGHPTSIKDVTQNDAHASLLVFPVIAGLVEDLGKFLNRLR